MVHDFIILHNRTVNIFFLTLPLFLFCTRLNFEKNKKLLESLRPGIQGHIGLAGRRRGLFFHNVCPSTGFFNLRRVRGGGGGGAGQPGQHGSSAPSGHGAYGGAGLNYSNEFGTSYSASGWFAGGGGGCNNAGRSGSGAGGTGGGGHGAGDGSNAGTGYPNTGGGGGGARDTGDGYGKPGGSGIVIIRYAI